MFNVEEYYAQLSVKHYEQNMRHMVEQKQLLRAAMVVRQPAAARLGDWMVKTGTALKGRYGNIGGSAPTIHPKRNTVRFNLS